MAVALKLKLSPREMAERYRAGRTLKQVAAEAGCGVTRVLRTLQGLKVPRRGRGNAGTTNRLVRALKYQALREAGLTLSEIGRRHDVSRQFVSAELLYLRECQASRGVNNGR